MPFCHLTSRYHSAENSEITFFPPEYLQMLLPTLHSGLEAAEHIPDDNTADEDADKDHSLHSIALWQMLCLWVNP